MSYLSTYLLCCSCVTHLKEKSRTTGFIVTKENKILKLLFQSCAQKGVSVVHPFLRKWWYWTLGRSRIRRSCIVEKEWDLENMSWVGFLVRAILVKLSLLGTLILDNLMLLRLLIRTRSLISISQTRFVSNVFSLSHSIVSSVYSHILWKNSNETLLWVYKRDDTNYILKFWSRCNVFQEIWGSLPLVAPHDSPTFILIPSIEKLIQMVCLCV